MTRRSLKIIDCTLREGDQAPGVFFTEGDKLAIFRALDELGVAVCDAGMPAISEEEGATLRALSALPGRRCRVAASVRAREDEIELARGCDVEEVFVIFPVSEQHRVSRLQVDEAAWRALGRRVIDAGVRHGLTVNLVLEDASRASREAFVTACLLAAEHGAARVMICDTVGTLTPTGATALTRLARETLEAGAGGARGVEIGVHFHDDFGMASANTVAAIEAGASAPSVTVNGIGERAGNAVLAEVATAAETLLQVATGVTLTGLSALSSLVERLRGVAQSQAAPITGARAFTHESGIHVHGLLRDRKNYEPFDPAIVGREHGFVFGKHTGHAGLVAFAEAHHVKLSREAMEQLLFELKNERPARYEEAVLHVLQTRDEFVLREHGVGPEELLRRMEVLAREGGAG